MSGFKYSSEHNVDLDDVYESGSGGNNTGFLVKGTDLKNRYLPYSFGYRTYVGIVKTQSLQTNDSIYTNNSININEPFQFKNALFFDIVYPSGNQPPERIHSDDGKYIYRFTQNGSIAFVNNTKVKISAVGGGGGGGTSSGPSWVGLGGGGGGVCGRETFIV